MPEWFFLTGSGSGCQRREIRFFRIRMFSHVHYCQPGQPWIVAHRPGRLMIKALALVHASRVTAQWSHSPTAPALSALIIKRAKRASRFSGTSRCQQSNRHCQVSSEQIGGVGEEVKHESNNTRRLVNGYPVSSGYSGINKQFKQSISWKCNLLSFRN